MKLSKAQREMLTRAANNPKGWTMANGSAAQRTALWLEARGLVERSEGSSNVSITDAGRKAIA